MKHHQIQKVAFSGEMLQLTVDDKEYSFDLKSISKALFKANASKRNSFEFDSFGYGIHWPELDEDLSIDGLIQSQHAIDNTKKLINA